MVKRPKTAKTSISRLPKSSPSDQFQRYLNPVGASPFTVRGYLADVGLFSDWFQQSRPDIFSPKSITPMDRREYKSYLMTVKAAKPATVSRRLIAVSRFCRWAKSAGLISDNPAGGIKLQRTQRLAPKTLTRQEQHVFIRAVEKNGSQRDPAVMHLLLGIGMRLSERANLGRLDINTSERV